MREGVKAIDGLFPVTSRKVVQALFGLDSAYSNAGPHDRFCTTSRDVTKRSADGNAMIVEPSANIGVRGDLKSSPAR